MATQRCPECGETFRSATGVDGHRTAKHGVPLLIDVPVECPECGRDYKNLGAFRRHREDEHGVVTHGVTSYRYDEGQAPTLPLGEPPPRPPPPVVASPSLTDRLRGLPWWAWVVAGIVILGVIGSFTEEEKMERKEASPAPAKLTASAATQVVRDYYHAIAISDYDEAWSLLGEDARADLGPRDRFEAGFEFTTDVRVKSADAISLGATTAEVEVEVRTEDIDACAETANQTLAGTWFVELVRRKPVLAIGDISKKSGREPVRNEANCATEETPPVASSCHPSYEGACLNPGASDYDCAGGSGDGPEYTGPVRVVGPDDFELDRDGDGFACE
jgi:uncharacterized C2H2 Zn-finger protein